MTSKERVEALQALAGRVARNRGVCRLCGGSTEVPCPECREVEGPCDGCEGTRVVPCEMCFSELGRLFCQVAEALMVYGAARRAFSLELTEADWPGEGPERTVAGELDEARGGLLRAYRALLAHLERMGEAAAAPGAARMARAMRWEARRIHHAEYAALKVQARSWEEIGEDRFALVWAVRTMPEDEPAPVEPVECFQCREGRHELCAGASAGGGSCGCANMLCSALRGEVEGASHGS